MKLEEYPDLKCKLGKFQQTIINTPTEFNEWYNQFDRIGFIFRGINEAKYKNYTSAQRDWITKEWTKSLNISFEDFVDRLLIQIKKDNLLKQYFQSLAIAPNDILYLSFMQHYAMPSPLLDFTMDLSKALFFATDELKYNPSSMEIENYFSVYALKPTIEYNHADVLFANALEDGKRMLEDFKARNPKVDVNSELLDRIDLLTRWKRNDGTNQGLYNYPITYIPNPMNATPVVTPVGERLFWSNPNIIAQDGCFVMNPSENMVLEDVVVKNHYMANMICVDIHRSLAVYIKNKYSSHLNHVNIYPKFKQLASKCYFEFEKTI